MKKLRKCVANCVTSFIQKFRDSLVSFLLEYEQGNFLDVYGARYALVPVKIKSPQKPAAVYRSYP